MAKSLFELKPKKGATIGSKQLSNPAIDNEVLELINRRRRQILVNSCIYYKLGSSVITDQTFDKWAYELVDLQEAHPAESKAGVYYEFFKGFDGSTGYHLPYTMPNILKVANNVLNYNRRKNAEKN